eukprot:scaffold12079_cov97-Cylindrotheca_fusiformis.AAC.2
MCHEMRPHRHCLYQMNNVHMHFSIGQNGTYARTRKDGVDVQDNTTTIAVAVVFLLSPPPPY